MLEPTRRVLCIKFIGANLGDSVKADTPMQFVHITSILTRYYKILISIYASKIRPDLDIVYFDFEKIIHSKI